MPRPFSATRPCRFAWDDACRLGSLCPDCPDRPPPDPRGQLAVALSAARAALHDARRAAARAGDARLDALGVLAAALDDLGSAP